MPLGESENTLAQLHIRDMRVYCPKKVRASSFKNNYQSKGALLDKFVATKFAGSS